MSDKKSVVVVCLNDYPDCVWATQEEANDYMEKCRERFADAPMRYMHSYEMTVGSPGSAIRMPLEA